MLRKSEVRDTIGFGCCSSVLRNAVKDTMSEKQLEKVASHVIKQCEHSESSRQYDLSGKIRRKLECNLSKGQLCGGDRRSDAMVVFGKGQI